MTSRSAPPLEFQAFTWFCVTITLLSFATLLNRTWLKALTPFLGWNPAGPYMFLIYFNWVLWRAALPTRSLLRIRWFMVGILLIAAALGVEEYQRMHGFAAEPSPFLRYHPLRPWVTVALPLFWGSVLFLPRVTTYLKTSAIRASDASR